MMRADQQTNIPPLRRRQRYEQIAERLVADMRAAGSRPGDRLPSERELARRLEVSRASVREALGRCRSGAVETRPGAGSFVAADAARRGSRPAARTPAARRQPVGAARGARVARAAVAALAAQRARAGRRGGAPARRDGGVPTPPTRKRARAGTTPTASSTASSPRMTGNPVLLAIAEHVAAFMDQPLWQRLRDESIAVPGRTRIHTGRAPDDLRGDGGRATPEAAEFYAARTSTRVRSYMAPRPGGPSHCASKASCPPPSRRSTPTNEVDVDALTRQRRGDARRRRPRLRRHRDDGRGRASEPAPSGGRGRDRRGRRAAARR